MIYSEIDGELGKQLLKRQNQVVYPQLFVKFEPKGCFLPREYAAYYDQIRRMEVRDEDIWVMSFIKSGNPIIFPILYNMFRL